ncbi:hypothetical protein ACFW04_013574 [Cataglyphis niger]
MKINDSHVAAAINALISESGSTPELRACIKRSNEKESSSSSTNTSGSSISLTDNIRNNRYSNSNAGTFDIHIQRRSNSNSSLHPYVGRIICELNIKEILEIKKIGYSKVSIFFKTKEAANILLIAFIPPFCTSKKDIIKVNISSSIKIVAANRLNRRTTTASNTNSQENSSPNFSYVSSLSVSLTFEGQKIPNYVYIYHVRYPVSPYIARVSRCNNCFRFGHIQNNCKSQPRCVHCGERHIYSNNCPQIKKYASYRNVSLLDAKEIFKAHSLNYIIFAIKQKLYEINSAGFENSIVWIPAHSGILENETADYLAKKAISRGQMSSKLLPHSDFYSIPRKRYYDTTIKFLKKQGNRKGNIVTICRLRSNHYALNYSLHRCNLVADPSCSYGSLKQDETSFGIQEILKNPFSEIIHALYFFLKSSNFRVYKFALFLVIFLYSYFFIR